MLTTYLNSLHEAFSRRMALVLFGVSLLVAVAFCRLPNIRPDGTLVVGKNSPMPYARGVPWVLGGELDATGELWLLLALLAAAPLVASTLEKGWLELTFSKGAPRWEIFLGHFLGGVTLYSLTFLLAVFPVASWLWWKTGIPTWQVGVALLVQTFSFAALLSVAALASLLQKGAPLPIMASAAIWFFSPLLARRQETYYRIFTSPGARKVIDWTYRILPKCSELSDRCPAFIYHGKLGPWWPFWSTGVFTLAILGLTLWLLERKSF